MSIVMLAMSCSVSCADIEMQDGIAGRGADEVAVTSEALGSWTEIYNYPSNTTALSISPLYAIFNKERNTCVAGPSEVTVVHIPTGTELSLQSIDVPCSTSVRAAVGDSNGTFVYDANKKAIYKLEADVNLTWKWTAIATNVPRPVRKIMASSTHVYWDEDLGISIYRVAKTGGAVTTLANGAYTLLGIEGSSLYIQRKEQVAFEPNRYHLEQMPVAGGAATTLHSTQQYSFMSGFTFDASHFYFTYGPTFEGGASKIIQLTKSGATAAVLRESTTKSYGKTFTNGSHLYWMERENTDTWGDDVRLYRRTLASGTTTSISTPVDYSPQLAVGAMNVWVVGEDPDMTTQEAIWRGAL